MSANELSLGNRPLGGPHALAAWAKVGVEGRAPYVIAVGQSGRVWVPPVAFGMKNKLAVRMAKANHAPIIWDGDIPLMPTDWWRARTDRTAAGLAILEGLRVFEDMGAEILDSMAAPHGLSLIPEH